MKTKYKIMITLFLFSSLLFSACGPGQIFGPAFTPTSTGTSTPAIIFTLTIPSTPTLAFTPTKPFSPTRTSTPTPGPAKTSTVTATYTITPSVVPTLAFIRPAGTDGDWIRYIHTVYGFSFSTPPGWTVSEWGANFIRVSSPADPDIKLTIGIRWATEDMRLTRTGVPAGEIVLAGEVPFFGENISRGILVWQGRDKEILYHNSTEIRVGERVFTLGFRDFNWDYDATDLTEVDEETADKIVESFGYPE